MPRRSLWEGMPDSLKNRYVDKISVRELKRNPNTGKPVPKGSLFRLKFETVNPTMTVQFLCTADQLDDLAGLLK